MTLLQLGAWAVAAVALLILIRHHVGYFRRARRYSFGAFLETGGWIVILLVAVGAATAGLAHPGTRAVEIASGIVGLLFIALGSAFR